MLEFKEQVIRRQLDVASKMGVFSFALAAASRLISCYEKYSTLEFGSVNRYPRQIKNLLWKTCLSNDALISIRDLEKYLSDVMQLLPDESHRWTESHIYADHGLAALAYAIRYKISEDPQEAAWAARRSYEAADQYAIKHSGIDVNAPDAEEAILAHQVVQRELCRQKRDIALAGSADILSLFKHAKVDSVID